MRVHPLVMVGVGLLLASCELLVGTAAAEEPLSAQCPAYVSHLRVARTLLAAGKRADAVRELDRARAALEACGAKVGGADVLARTDLSGRAA